MALHGRLPSLAGLKPGAWTGTGEDTDEEDCLPELTWCEEKDRPCDVHKESNPTDPGWPFRFVITQAQADKWFEEATRINIDNNIYGDTAILRDADVNGAKVDIVIKLFKGMVDPDTNRMYQQSSPARAKLALEYEVAAHLAVWDKLKDHPECRQYLSIPACMNLRDAGGTRQKWYSVQTLIQKPGLNAMGLGKFHLIADSRLRKLSIAARHEIASNYGEMLACIASTGYVHFDMHWDNIMVLSNIADFEDGQIDETFRMEWRVIDWGKAASWVKQDGTVASPDPERGLCVDPKYKAADLWWSFPSYTVSEGHSEWCSGEEKAKDSFLVYMLRELVDINVERRENDRLLAVNARKLRGYEANRFFVDDPADPRYQENEANIEELKKKVEGLNKKLAGSLHYLGPVTETVVLQWVREAYAKKLDFKIPEAIQKAVDAQLEKDAAKGGGNGSMPVVHTV